MKNTMRVRHLYYLEPDKEICHFYRHCSKIKGELVEIDSGEYSREYICKFNNNYRICKNCSDINWRQLMKITVAIMCAVQFLAVSLKCKYIDVRKSKLWITSPRGENYQISHYQALRIVRKHNWRIAETMPKISRWQAFKYILGVKTCQS